MTEILEFNKEHIERAKKIVLINYNEEKAIVTALPQVPECPDLEPFADNGLGVAMLNGDEMLGFLCCYKPRDNVFNSAARGIFSPVQAHGAVSRDRGTIYKRLYQAAAQKWVSCKITSHAIALYAHDSQALNAFFTYGFGMRCVDAVRALAEFEHKCCEGITFSEIAKTESSMLREMRRLLAAHMGESPCFMYSPPKAVESWIERAEKRDTREFIAMQGGSPVAFIEIGDDGEAFVTETGGMMNICGAFCLREHRGKGVAQGLLNYAISVLKAEGYESLGVDFESFNPTASGFWLKHFTAYTNSVVRRIDECALAE